MKRNLQKILTGVLIAEVIISSIVLIGLIPLLNNNIIEQEDDSNSTRNPEGSPVYSPWTREVIWSDIGETYRGAFIPTDIEYLGTLRS